MYDPVAEPEPVGLERPPRILLIQRLAALFEVVLCSGFPTQLLLIAVLGALGMRLRTPGGQLSPPFVFALSLLDTIIMIGLVLFLLRAHRESARTVLLGHRSIAREALVGVFLTPAIFMLVVVILTMVLALAPALHNVSPNPLQDLLTSRGDAVVFALVAMIAGGVREEVQRGFILHRFDEYLGGGPMGVLVFSVIFGFGHIDQGFDAVIATSVLGAAWGILYLARRSIVAPMVSHAGFNLTQVVKSVVVGG